MSNPRNLKKGAIVVLSGGAFDEMNPVEVRDRMEEYIASVNIDPYVQANTEGNGLTFKLLSNQETCHVHQAQWRQICHKLGLLAATPLVVVGHSNGGAAAMNIARCLKAQGKSVDLVFSADSVRTLDDLGNINQVPSNIAFNFNSYVKPTPAWLLAPFPIGLPNRREQEDSLDGILNIGLTFNLPGALAHRNAFYELAGGDKNRDGTYQRPHLLLELTLAVLRGENEAEIFSAARASLQKLATKVGIEIDLETTNLRETLLPSAHDDPVD